MDNENTPRLLMSDALQGQVPMLEGEDGYDRLVVAVRGTMGGATKIEGVLRSVLMDSEAPEIEFRTLLVVAFRIIDEIDKEESWFENFIMTHGQQDVYLRGPFVVKAARIQDIEAADPSQQLCTLALSLRHTKKQL